MQFCDVGWAVLLEYLRFAPPLHLTVLLLYVQHFASYSKSYLHFAVLKRKKKKCNGTRVLTVSLPWVDSSLISLQPCLLWWKAHSDGKWAVEVIKIVIYGFMICHMVELFFTFLWHFLPPFLCDVMLLQSFITENMIIKGIDYQRAEINCVCAQDVCILCTKNKEMLMWFFCGVGGSLLNKITMNRNVKEK